MKYSPKRDKFYTLIVRSAPIILTPFLIFSFSLTILTIFALSFLLSFWIWNSTSYKIEDGNLILNCWIFKRETKVKDIERIRKTNNFISSYALALERLEITEKNKSVFYLSPENFETFIADLEKYNPNIKPGD